MRNKKKEINLSILLIIVTIIISFICWRLKTDYPVFEFFFALSSGICGSSFATLCIFISNYRTEKEKLLRTVFQEGLYICGQLPFFEDFVSDQRRMEEYLAGKTYISPTLQMDYNKMCPEEKTLYNICRYVDSFLELGYERIEKFWDDINSIDFWTDPIELPDSFASSKILRKLWNKNYLAINKSKKHRINVKFFPVYIVLMSPSVAEDKYIFYNFSDFRDKKRRPAYDIYCLVKELDHKINGPCDEIKWIGTDMKGLRSYLHESLWIFRDAFLAGKSIMRDEALKALMTGSKYKYIR